MNYNQSNNTELSCKNNDIPFSRRSQHNHQYFTKVVDNYILSNPTSFFQNELNEPRKIILNYFLAVSNVLRNIYFTQSYIAYKTGYSREYINRVLAEFRELGLIDYNYRHMRSCVYRISSWFYKPETRAQLKSIFVALAYACLVIQNPDQIDAITRINIIYKENINLRENRHSHFEFENFHKIDYNKKRENSDMTAFLQAVDSVFDSSHNSTIPQYIHELQPIFGLTTHGKYYLSSYPLAALQYAAQPLIKSQPVSAWRYFDKILKNYCEQRNVEPNWQMIQALPREVIDEPMVVKDGVSIDKRALKNWLSTTKQVVKQPETVRQQLLSCCDNCQLKKTLPIYPSGRPNTAICDKIRKATEGQPGYNSAGELYTEARKKMYDDWATTEGLLKFRQTVKLLGWNICRDMVNAILHPDDHLPEQEPENIVTFIHSKITSPS